MVQFMNKLHQLEPIRLRDRQWFQNGCNKQENQAWPVIRLVGNWSIKIIHYNAHKNYTCCDPVALSVSFMGADSPATREALVLMRNKMIHKRFEDIFSFTLQPLRVTGIKFLLIYHPWIKHWGNTFQIPCLEPFQCPLSHVPLDPCDILQPVPGESDVLKLRSCY